MPMRTARTLGIDLDRVNVNGGAIALGHRARRDRGDPARHRPRRAERSNKSTALITLCIGGGMGIATIIERV